MLPPARSAPDRLWRVTVEETGAVIGDRIRRANTFGSRIVGLLGRTGLAEDEGLLIEETWSIHMFFMLFRIDCAYLDRQLRVTKIVRRLSPFAMSWSGVPLAAHTLELPAGRCDSVELQVGHRLRFVPASGATGNGEGREDGKR